MKWSEERDPSTNHLKYHLANFTTKEESEENGFTVRRVIAKDLQKIFFFWTNQFGVNPTPSPHLLGPQISMWWIREVVKKERIFWIFYGQGGRGVSPLGPDHLHLIHRIKRA